MNKDPIIIEEPWLEITTRTGLKIEMPAPEGGMLLDISQALRGSGLLAGRSKITGETHYVKTGEVVHIRQYTRRHDPERHQRSLLRATKTSSPTSSGSSQAAASTSASQASPSSGSPGVASLRTIH